MIDDQKYRKKKEKRRQKPFVFERRRILMNQKEEEQRCRKEKEMVFQRLCPFAAQETEPCARQPAARAGQSEQPVKRAAVTAERPQNEQKQHVLPQ